MSSARSARVLRWLKRDSCAGYRDDAVSLIRISALYGRFLVSLPFLSDDAKTSPPFPPHQCRGALLKKVKSNWGVPGRLSAAAGRGLEDCSLGLSGLAAIVANQASRVPPGPAIAFSSPPSPPPTFLLLCLLRTLYWHSLPSNTLPESLRSLLIKAGR